MRDLLPGVPVLSEERAIAFKTLPERYWLVDPLDGTKEFLARNGEFCICLSLIESRRSSLALLFEPLRACSYVSFRGSGRAWQRDEDSSGWVELIARRSLVTRPYIITERGVEARSPERANTGLRIFMSRHHKDSRSLDWLKFWPDHTLISKGSALKFVDLAKGEADLYLRFGPTSTWDTSAGQLILEEMGGEVLSMDGRVLEYPADRWLNPAFLASAPLVQ